MVYLNLTANIPLYQALANTLSERIREGYWAVGSSLPSESELCTLFNASRHTLRHALSNLERDGLAGLRRISDAVEAYVAS